MITQGTDDIDAAVREVNELLGESGTRGSVEADGGACFTGHRSLLTIERRCVCVCVCVDQLIELQ